VNTNRYSDLKKTRINNNIASCGEVGYYWAIGKFVNI